MEKPLVSILIPVYNREKYIAQTIESVINQTYQNWELIIIDDNSSDQTIKIVRLFNDARITLICKTINEGVSRALNEGIAAAKGDFIGRLDSDDVALNHRLEKQVNFFENNPDVDICGSWIKILNSDKLLKYSELHPNILTDLILYSPIGAPTALLRKCVFQKYSFNEKLRYGEDYEFWSRALFDFKSYNIQEALIYYRRHEDQLTNNISSIKSIGIEIKMNLLKRLEYDEKKFSDKIVNRFLLNQSLYALGDIELYFKWCEHLVERNAISNVFPKKEFILVNKVLRARMIEEIFFRHNHYINKYNRLQTLQKITHMEKFTVLKRKIKKILFN